LNPEDQSGEPGKPTTTGKFNGCVDTVDDIYPPAPPPPPAAPYAAIPTPDPPPPPPAIIRYSIVNGYP
jgi:hypothetical protein